MKLEMFDMVNYDSWGSLVKKWAHDKTSRPADIAAFKQQLQDAGVGATFHHEYTDLVFVETSSTDPVLRIKLPPPEILNQAELDLQNENYPLPPFYGDEMINPNLNTNTIPNKLVFHAKRVGEYTVKFCG